ncbi:MAG: MFS transporter, partial [Ignavibacteria bacterium]
MNPWKGLKKLPREMWIIAGGTLINRTGTMVLPFLALYLTTKINLSPDKAGFIITFYGIGALVTAPFVGKLADKIGAFL